MPISGHDTDEVMNMKKFLGGIKKNIFYISLITGMAVLVTVLGLYNADQFKGEDHNNRTEYAE